MSIGDSPRKPPLNFDSNSYFDPEFSMEITRKMHVPDKISVHNGDAHNPNYDVEHDKLLNMRDANEWMRVPNRIIVAGGDKFVSGTPAPSPLKLDLERPGDLNKDSVQLMSPPRHLTLNELSAEPENDLNIKSGKRSTAAKELNYSPLELSFGSPMQESFSRSFLDSKNQITSPEVEMVTMKRQMRALARKVSVLERENSQRYQRDVLIYAIGLVYVVIRGFSWLNRRW